MIYQSLDVSRFEARLLRLLDIPSDPLKPARFETITISLIRPPEYFALSYCWGDDTHKSSIEVNGETIHVTKNLAAALRYSDFHPGTLIWADAICINQQDVNEKAHQIRLMGLIYSKAQATAVWLGDEEKDTRYARTFLEEVEPDDQDGLGSISGDKFTTALSNTPHPIRSLRGLHELLTRPYWERVWIIQEIAKARTVYVRCGSLCFNLGSVIASTEHMDDLPQRSRILISAIHEFRLQESEARRGGLRMSLLQALIKSRHSLATNPRDKVYALLNLARDGNDLVPTPTYTEPVEEVFRELTMTFFQSPHPMEAMILSSRAPLNAKSEAQPLWAVDWSDLAFHTPHWLTSNLSARFNGLVKEKGFGAPSFTPRSVKLRGHGQLLGFIDSISDTSTEPVVQLPHEARQKSIAVMDRVSSNLRYLLMQGNPDSRGASCTESTIALAHLIANTNELNIDYRGNPYLEEVLKHLQGLVINSFPIQVWAKGYIEYGVSRMFESIPRLHRDDSKHSTSINAFKFFQGRAGALRGRFRPFADFSRLSISALQTWVDVFATLSFTPEYGLRFATSGDNIVLVSSATKIGDAIYRLDSCYFPMVLREVIEKSRGRRSYKIINEACIGVDADGHWISARDCPWTIKYSLENLEILG
ncbi:HET-domain-containing protein [Annulohypoxylon nitens]|nr:HET-domain-containing protein [Annulohypoxylon nitens]